MWLTIPWTLEVGGLAGGASTDSGPHTVFITYGLPRGDVTLPRVLWVTQTCDGLSAPQDCVGRIFAASPFVALRAWSPLVWKVPGYGGQCRDIAEFCLEAADMLGLPEGAGQVRVLYPYKAEKAEDRPGSDGYDDNDRRTVTSPPHPPEHLAYIFPGDGEQHREWLVYKACGMNGAMFFEACFRYSDAGATRWYAGGVGVYDDSQTVAKDILVDCVDLTFWAYLKAVGIGQCVTPGPPVEHNWPK